VQSYVAKRILEPIAGWYTRAVSKRVTSVIPDFGSAEFGPDAHVTKIEQQIDFSVFNPKRSLMSAFSRKVEQLSDVARAELAPRPRRIIARTPPKPEVFTCEPARAKNQPRLGIEEQQRLRSEREKLLAQLDACSVQERMRFIAKDCHSLDYFRPEYAQLGEEGLKLIDDETTGLLKARLEGRRRGPWKRLLDELVNLRRR
jgi:hypothetical protein